MPTLRFHHALLGMALLLTGLCSQAGSQPNDGRGPVRVAANTPIPASITSIMKKPRYAGASWSLLVTDIESGETLYALNPDRQLLTGSTRKLFSVGMALNTLGADHRETTAVHRQGKVDERGVLKGNLVLVAGGDLTFGGRRLPDGRIQFTNFDHGDANSLGSADLTPQNPLYALDRLAASIKASGINAVSGEVAIDDRLFVPYRVPNGNLLVTPMMLNENQVDVSIEPTRPGRPAHLTYRPATQAVNVSNGVRTTARGTAPTVAFSNQRLITSVPTLATVRGNLPVGYVAPLTGIKSYVGTFQISVPDDFTRTAFIEALRRHGVTVKAAAVEANPTRVLPPTFRYAPETRVASYVSAAYAQQARLILKVSLNLGANLSLSLFGLAKGTSTIQGSLAAERKTLIEDFGIDGSQFDFPTNGSGSPDSKAAPRAIVQLLIAMSKTKVAAAYRSALPILGVDGSLATTGTHLPGRGHVFAKPGTTVSLGPDGKTLELKAQNLAGYIETKSGRKLAYVVMVNNAGPVKNVAVDVTAVFEDEGAISSIIYESL